MILAVRNLEAGEAAKLSIEKTTKCDSSVIEVWPLNLGSYDSVKAFAARVNNELPRLDICIMNAGKATDKFSLFEGHESTITVNVISTFLLALLVLPKMKETRKKNPDASRPTLTIVASTAHEYTKFPLRNSKGGIFNALDDASNDMSDRYPVSKLLDIVGTKSLAEQISKDENGEPLVIVNSLCPGLCHSELGRESGWSLWILKQLLARTTEVGSRCLVHAGAAGNIEQGEKINGVDGGLDVHGKFLSDCVVYEPNDVITGKGKLQGLKGEELQTQIWSELSEIMEAVVPGVTKNA